MDEIDKYYQILGLDPGASEEEIKQTYRDLVNVWHPDRFSNNPRLKEKANEKLKEINTAYENLKTLAKGRRFEKERSATTMANESSLVHVNDKNFAEEVLNSNLPVLVDFWATWSGPCLSISPTIEELAKEFSGKVKVTKLNVDQNPDTPSHYGVRGIPTILLLKDGKILGQIVGAVPKARLIAMIENAL